MIVRAVVAINICAILTVMVAGAVNSQLTLSNVAVGLSIVALHGALGINRVRTFTAQLLGLQ